LYTPAKQGIEKILRQEIVITAKRAEILTPPKKPPSF
jgi:hypothetical protein